MAMSTNKDCELEPENHDQSVDPIISLNDVLNNEEAIQEQILEAEALLGGQDDSVCTYPEGYKPRQPLYACRTCTKDGMSAGICYGCSLNCHDGHDLIELYTKRNFCCDCGNSKFNSKCGLYEEKLPVNARNSYGHNFSGLYCVCDKPYPPTDESEDLGTMVQCNSCEDWFHLQHVIDGYNEADAANGAYEGDEMFCSNCVAKLPFLIVYTSFIQTKNSSDNSSSLAIDLNACKFEAIKQSNSTLNMDAKTLIIKDCNWRAELCKCQKCINMYEDANCAFLTEHEDTLQFYIAQNEHAASSKPAEKPIERELYDYVAEKQSHDVALMVLSGFEQMKSQLNAFMLEKAKENKVIKKEDVENFFEGLRAAKRRRMDGEE